MTHSLMTSCKKYKMAMQPALVVLPIKMISKMTIVSMISLGTKKCMIGICDVMEYMSLSECDVMEYMSLSEVPSTKFILDLQKS